MRGDTFLVLLPAVQASGRTEAPRQREQNPRARGPLVLPELRSGYAKQGAPRARTATFLSSVLNRLDESAERLGLSADLAQRIAEPERTLAVKFRVAMDDGTSRELVFRRILQSTALGPGKGGIRWAEGAGKSVVGALAFEMPLKASIYGLPLGGAKGGIDLDPTTLSVREAAAVMRGSIRSAMDKVWRTEEALAFGPRTDIPAPDVGTSHPEINLMNLAADEYLAWLVDNGLREADGFGVPEALRAVERGAETETPYVDRYLELFEKGVIPNLGLIATFTGKSVDKGGSLGRTEATGLGVAYATIELLKHHGVLAPEAKGFAGQSVAVQGFGNVGQGAVASFTDLGAKVVAIADFDGSPYAITREGGFDPETVKALAAYKREKKTLRGFPGTEVVSTADFWKLPVDIMAPCARENEVTAKTAEQIRARYLVEGANGPTTEDADEILADRGVTVLPDIFANAAGAIVSWFEMLQNMRGERWPLERVKRELSDQMSRAFDLLVEGGGDSFRDAAFDRAVLNIAEALKERA